MIHVPDATWDAVKEQAKKDGISASQFVREAIQAVLTAEQNNHGPVRRRVQRQRD